MDRSQELHQEISRVAYEIYERRGAYGLELEDWMEAERIVMERFPDIRRLLKYQGKLLHLKKAVR